MIGHTQLFLWSRYSDIISLLTITVRGYQISIAYCLFVCIIRDADFNSDHYGLPAIIYVLKFFFHFVFLSTKSAVVGSWSPYDLKLHTNASYNRYGYYHCRMLTSLELCYFFISILLMLWSPQSISKVWLSSLAFLFADYLFIW